MTSPFIVDAHLDLSMNAMEWNRDLTQSVDSIRERESGMNDKPDRGNGAVAFPDMRQGKVGLCVATQIARYVDRNHFLPGWHSQEQAWAQTQGQLAWYKAMEARGEMRSIKNKSELEAHLSLWGVSVDPVAATGSTAGAKPSSTAGAKPGSTAGAKPGSTAGAKPGSTAGANSVATGEDRLPIGYVLSLEGADSIYELSCLETAFAYGLRALGPAHYGPGVYAFGTDSVGPMGPKGRALLKEMERLGIILDATHLCDESFWEALAHFHGPVWASHHNVRALVPHNRQLSHEMIRALIHRGAVIGTAFDAWMLIPGWQRGISTPQSTGVSMHQHIADHIDAICQLAGNSLHSGIGSDLDGAFGTEQSPGDLDTIADLQKLPDILSGRGYNQGDIDNILYKNWIRFLQKNLPE